MTNAIVVVGSLHYDIMIDAPHQPRTGETVTGQRWFPKFGGKGGNQAVAAAKAGAVTRFVGAVGDDGFAPLMLDTLRHHKISTGYVATVPNCGTGMSVAITDADGDYGAVIVSGANLKIDLAQFDHTEIWAGAKILVLQNEVPEEVNMAAATAAKREGLQVCLNAAPYRALSDAFMAQIDILVVNAVEAEDMGSCSVTDLSSARRAAETLGRGLPIAIVTAGAHGVAWSVNGGQAESIDAVPVKVISTHGAGDAFIGTMCQAIASGHSFRTAIERANEAAARVISTT